MGNNLTKPYLIDFPKIGSTNIGYVSVAEKASLPFVPKRIYWTYFTPESVERGAHAHKELQQVLVALAGVIDLEIELLDGETIKIRLDTPAKGVFVPELSWRKMKYSHNAVQLCIASMEYTEKDYIRSYNDFKQLASKTLPEINRGI